MAIRYKLTRSKGPGFKKFRPQSQTSINFITNLLYESSIDSAKKQQFNKSDLIASIKKQLETKKSIVKRIAKNIEAYNLKVDLLNKAQKINVRKKVTLQSTPILRELKSGLAVEVSPRGKVNVKKVTVIQTSEYGFILSGELQKALNSLLEFWGDLKDTKSLRKAASYASDKYEFYQGTFYDNLFSSLTKDAMNGIRLCEELLNNSNYQTYRRQIQNLKNFFTQFAKAISGASHQDALNNNPVLINTLLAIRPPFSGWLTAAQKQSVR